MGVGPLSFIKKIATLLSGSVIAQLLTFASYPILTLWLAPEQWATLGIFSAFVGVFSVWSCGGLESAILLPDQHGAAYSLWRIARRWGIYLGALASVALSIGLWYFPEYFSDYYFVGMVLLTGLSVFLEGGILSTMQWNNRLEAFGVMSKSRMIQALVSLGLSIVLAFVVPKYNGVLVFAWVLGQLAAYVWLNWNLKHQLKIENVHHEPEHLAFASYAHFPLPSMISSLFNSISRQLPFFILPVFGNAALMGNFTLAHKVLSAPIAFIGASLTQVFNVKSSKGYRDGGDLHDWTKRWLWIFTVSSFIPLFIIIFFGNDLFRFFFGDEYQEAGTFAAYLAPWIFVLYWINPLSHLINVHHALKQHLYYNSMVLLLRGLSLWLMGVWMGFEAAVAGFGTIGLLAALFMASWLWRLSKNSKSEPLVNSTLNPQPLKIVFTGDVAFTGSYAKRLANNEEIWSNDVQRLFNDAAASVINWEGACTDRNIDRRRGDSIAQPFRALTYCIQRNINVFNLANNHILDEGAECAGNTTQKILDLGEMPLGLNTKGEWDWTPQYICLNGLTVALLAVEEDERKLDRLKLRRHLKTIRSNCDYIVLNYHGGEEYSDIPFPFKKRRLLSLIHEDIDVIIAHHPHVVQPEQRIGKKWIFYSLGNFIFDIAEQSGRNKIEQGALLQLNFFADRIEPIWTPLVLDNEKGIISVGNGQWLTDLQSKWESKDYLSLWTEECHRIRKEEQKLTSSMMVSKATEKEGHSSRMKWRSIFNPTRRTLLIGDWIYRWNNK